MATENCTKTSQKDSLVARQKTVLSVRSDHLQAQVYHDSANEDNCLVFYMHIKMFLLTYSIHIHICVREGLKKSIMENSILGGEGGVSEGHFPYPIFLIFFAPNGLKIIFRH